MYRAKADGNSRGRGVRHADAAPRGAPARRGIRAAPGNRTRRAARVLPAHRRSRTGRVANFEALIRWDRRGVGLIRPDNFIPSPRRPASSSRSAPGSCGTRPLDCAGWQSVAPGVGVSVNVSVRQFESGDLVHEVQEALAEQRPRARPAHPRDHGVGDARPHRTQRRDHATDPRPRDAHLARRLRQRLQLAHLSSPAPDRLDQDRSVVPPIARNGRTRRRHAAGDRQPRRRARPRSSSPRASTPRPSATWYARSVATSARASCSPSRCPCTRRSSSSSWRSPRPRSSASSLTPSPRSTPRLPRRHARRARARS